MEAGCNADPQRRRLTEPHGERERLERAGARLLAAYYEELNTLEELRSRIPALRRQKRILDKELEAIDSLAEERERYFYHRHPTEPSELRVSRSRDTQSHQVARAARLDGSGIACRCRRNPPPFHTDDRRERLIRRQTGFGSFEAWLRVGWRYETTGDRAPPK